MDPKKLQDIAKILNTTMTEEGILADISIKTIWERLMSCIAQGRETEVKLAFPIRVELHQKIKQELPSKLDFFRKHVQDLDDEMNKMLPSPNMSLTNEDDDAEENEARQKSAETTKKSQAKVIKSESKQGDAISIQDELDDKSSQIQNLAEKIQELEEKLASFNDSVRPTCDKNVETESNNETDLDKEVEVLRNKIAEKDDELKRCNADINHLHERLSMFMTAAFHDENDYVADLSDPNRPVKLGERYSELYDNEWTDGFEILTTELLYEDTVAIKKLVEILYDSYEFCEAAANEHLLGITARLIDPSDTKEKDMELDVLSTKALHDLRRQTGKYSVSQIQMMFMKHVQKTSQDGYTEDIVSKLQPYILKCVELCWYMAIQSPPVYISSRMKTIPGELFNTDWLKYYSETGDKLDYVVWPPLFVKKGGSVLCKGVAQPRGIL